MFMCVYHFSWHAIDTGATIVQAPQAKAMINTGNINDVQIGFECLVQAGGHTQYFVVWYFVSGELPLICMLGLSNIPRVDVKSEQICVFYSAE